MTTSRNVLLSKPASRSVTKLLTVYCTSHCNPFIFCEGLVFNSVLDVKRLVFLEIFLSSVLQIILCLGSCSLSLPHHASQTGWGTSLVYESVLHGLSESTLLFYMAMF